MQVVGVDGAPGGWVAVVFDTQATGADQWKARFHSSFADLLSSYSDVPCIGIDMPIGLVEGGHCQCDAEARVLLGPKRSSVFSAPDPRLFDISTHSEATARAVKLTGKGISQQSFGILRKVAEVNRAITPGTQDQLIEVHPELSFMALAGTPILSKKKRLAGYEESAALLSNAMETAIPNRREARSLARTAAPEDILDALVAAWTAVRVVEGTAVRIPSEPQIGTNGLRMQIAY